MPKVFFISSNSLVIFLKNDIFEELRLRVKINMLVQDRKEQMKICEEKGEKEEKERTAEGYWFVMRLAILRDEPELRTPMSCCQHRGAR